LTQVKRDAAARGSVQRMGLRTGLAVALLACSAVALGQTIYKHRASDGRTVYSSERLPGLELIETFEYRFPPPAAPQHGADAAARQAEERIRRHIDALNVAWNEVRDAQAALAAAEARMRAGIEPQEGEATTLAGPPRPAPPAVGGPGTPAPRAAGGPGPAAPPAVGGPMGTGRGGGRSAEYFERQARLEGDVADARARLERAIQRYNALR
jgi:hypothetical protein